MEGGATEVDARAPLVDDLLTDGPSARVGEVWHTVGAHALGELECLGAFGGALGRGQVRVRVVLLTRL